MSKSTKKSLPSQVLYFWPEKIERKKENSISDRDKCLDKISNGSKCTLSDILDRWSSQGQDSIEWEKYKDENHKICGTSFTSNSLCSQNKSCEMEAARITPSLNDDFKKKWTQQMIHFSKLLYKYVLGH